MTIKHILDPYYCNIVGIVKKKDKNKNDDKKLLYYSTSPVMW